MIKEKKIEWKVIVGLVIILMGVVGTVFYVLTDLYVRKNGDDSLFSWDGEVLNEEEWGSLITCMNQTHAGVLYQAFPKESLEEATAAPFVKMLHQHGVDAYALVGDAQWAYEEDGKHLLKWIRRVAAYNAKEGMKSRIRGVMVDVEPHLLNEWNDGDMDEQLKKSYLAGIGEGYTYAKEHGLTYLVCIPYYYDNENEDLLTQLIAKECDGIAVMNYNRTDEYGQMEREVELAKEYDKQVVCIYELQESGTHDLEDINTYAEEGLKALWNSQETLREQFDYDGLSFSYHYYKPLREMLK